MDFNQIKEKQQITKTIELMGNSHADLSYLQWYKIECRGDSSLIMSDKAQVAVG